MSYFKTIYTFLFIMIFSIMFSACSGSSGTNNSSETVPSIEPFIAHIDIDTNTTNTVLGKIGTISEGGSNIVGYTLDGIGKDNFIIDKYGEVSIVSYAASIKYNLTVVARNSFGDSAKQEMIVEVTSLDQPVIQNKIVKTDDSVWSGYIGNLALIRDGNGSTLFSNIKEIEVVGENYEDISIDGDGNIDITGVNGSLQEGKYYFKIRAINNSGIIGPYSPLVVDVEHYEYVYYEVNYDDDYADDLYGAYNWLNISSVYPSSSISGYMDYDHDHDYIGFYMEEDGNVTIDLTTNGYYSYTHSGDYIALYDEFYNIYSTWSLNYPSTFLPAGQYYINVHQTSDYYTVTVNFN